MIACSDDRDAGHADPLESGRLSERADGDQHDATDTDPLDDVREADKRMVAAVRQAGRDSSEFRYLSEALAQSAMGTLTRMRPAQIFDRLKKLGIRLAPPPPEYTHEQQSLMFLATSRATSKFMDQYILGGRWDPDRGSLRHVFHNACLLQFANEYKSARSTWTSTEYEILTPDIHEDIVSNELGQIESGPEQRALVTLELEKLLEKLSPNERLIILRRAQGWLNRDIARELGVSPAAVDSTLRRTRRRHFWMKEQAEDSGADEPSLALPRKDSARVRRAWMKLRKWGICNDSDARTAMQSIERSRSLYESPRRPALYRPLPGDDRNQLDIILGGMHDKVVVPDHDRWVRNSARVCRDVLERIQEDVPSFQRPEGRRKGSSDDLRDLYLALASVVASLE